MKKRIIISLLLVFACGPLTYLVFPELVHLDVIFANSHGNYEKSEVRQAILIRHLWVFPVMLLSMLVIPYNLIVMRRSYTIFRKLLIFYALVLFWILAYLVSHGFFVLIYPLVKIVPYLILMPIVFVVAIHFLVDKKDASLLKIQDLEARQASIALVDEESDFLKKT